jgi:hypothetical protein
MGHKSWRKQCLAFYRSNTAHTPEPQSMRRRNHQPVAVTRNTQHHLERRQLRDLLRRQRPRQLLPQPAIVLGVEEAGKVFAHAGGMAVHR